MALIDDIIAYWTGTGFADEVNSHDLTETSGTIAAGTGKIGDAWTFAAADTEYLTIADASFADFPTSAATFSVWCKPASLVNGIVFQKGGTGACCFCYMEADGDLVFYPTPFTASCTVTGFFSAGAWVHLVIVFDGSQTGNDRVKIYKNGSAATVAYSGSMPAALSDTADAFNIGGPEFGYHFDGLIDEFGIWDAAKDSAAAAELYNSGAGFAYPFTPPADDISLTEFPTGKVFQRTKDTTAKTITFAGEYTTADPATIEVEIYEAGTSTVVQSWAALSGATIGSGAWTGTRSINQHDTMLEWKARSKDGGGSVIATSDQSAATFGVGVVVLMIGQSNMERMFNISSTPPSVNPLTTKFAGTWEAPGGNGAIRFADQLQQTLELPIGILDYAVDATGLVAGADLGAGYWDDNSSNEPLDLALDGLTAAGGDCEFVLWHQGENDAVQATSKANYKTAMDTLYGRIRTATSRSTSQLKFGCALLSGNNAGLDPDADTDAIRQAHLEWATETTGAFIAGSSADRTVTQVGGDSYHWFAADYETMGRRYAQAIAYQLGEVAYGADGPAISSAYWEVGTNDLHVVIAHDGGSALEELDGTTDGGSVTGFEVSDDAFSGTLTISSTAFSGDEVVLTMSANRDPGATIVLRYQYGTKPTITNPVYDNTNIQGGTLGLPLLPSLGNVTVSEDAPAPPSAAGLTFSALRATNIQSIYE